MKEKILNKLSLKGSIQFLLAALLSVSVMLGITCGIFVYKLNTGQFPTRIDTKREHKSIQDTVNAVSVKVNTIYNKLK